MVEQILPNTYRDWTAAYERGEARGRDNKLRGLASLYQSAPQQEQASILSQMAGVDPEFAAKQEDRMVSREDRRREQLAGMARGWKSVPSEQRQAYYERFIAPAVSQMGFGDLGPYDEAAVDGVATQILAAYGGGTPGGAVQSTYVDAMGNRVAIMRDGSKQVLGQNAPDNQLIDTGNGFYGVNKSSLSAVPVMVGGQPQQAPQPSIQAGLYQTPAGMVRIGEGLTPEQQQVALMDIQGGGAVDSVQLPARNVAPQQYGGGQQLRSAPKDGAAPAGYRRTADGNLEFIPGGPADPFLKNERTSPTAAKPIPVGALNQVLGAQDALGSTQVISDIIQKHARRMQSGELIVGPVDTIGAKFRTVLGMANAQDVNLNEWEADKTKIVNESLRLNKGVQTEGDAQRAVQELMGARDQATAARALRRLAELNARAVQLQKQKLTTIYSNYGRGADGEPVQRRQPAQGGGVDDLLSKYGAN